VLGRRVGVLTRRVDALTRGSDAASLEEVLASHLQRVHEVGRSIEKVEARTAVLERDLPLSLARVGLVRYNPFEDTGGNQSFALAVIDGSGDGFVVSSLHSRAATRIYAKAIARGKSEGALSGEETEALRIAMDQPVPGSAR
jgi:hypothetical protein